MIVLGSNFWGVIFIILLLLSNRALYWFTAIGSETVFYCNLIRGSSGSSQILCIISDSASGCQI